MMESVHLENDQILLRPILEQDFSLLQSKTQDHALWDFFTHNLSTMAGMRDWAQPAMNGERLQFVVVDKKKRCIDGFDCIWELFSKRPADRNWLDLVGKRLSWKGNQSPNEIFDAFPCL